MIRVTIVDDHPLVRRGLRETLSAEADITVVAEASRSEEVLASLAARPTDVLLLDLSMPGRGGLEVLGDVRHEYPRVRILVVSAYQEALYGVRAVRAGASGFLAKSSPTTELVQAVRAVYTEGRYISPAVGAALLEYARAEQPGARHDALSPRELQVLQRIVEGQAASEIADGLSLSVKTVSTYRRRLLDKLGLTGTADLVRYAVEHRLFDESLR